MFYYCMVYTLLTTNDAIQITPGEREFTSNCVQIGNGLSGERPQLYTTTQSERVEYVLFIKLCHLKGAISSSSRKCIYILHRISVLLFRCLDVCRFHFTSNQRQMWLHDELCEWTNGSGTFQVTSTFQFLCFDWF